MMKLSTLVVAVCAVLFVGVAGCNQAQKEAAAPAPQAQPMPDMGQAISGKVVETMNAGGYTYVCVEHDGQKTWVAGPQAKVKVGQTVTCEPGMVMHDFTSKTLKRTFPNIVFSSGIH